MGKILSFLLKRSVLISLAVVMLGYGAWAYFSKGVDQVSTLAVRPSDFLQQVSVSGTVIPSESLDLSFEQGGRVSSVSVKVGQRVSAGQVLVSQATSDLVAQLSEARANVDLQQARLNQIIAGASSEDLKTAQTTVDNAKQALLNTLQTGFLVSDDAIHNKVDQLFFHPNALDSEIRIYSISGATDSALNTSRAGFESTLFPAWKNFILQLSDNGDFNQYVATELGYLNQVKNFLDLLATSVNNPDTPFRQDYSTNISGVPSTIRADFSTARTSVSTAINNLTSAKNTLNSSIAQLKLTAAPIRDVDVATYRAQIAQAQASEQNISSQLAKRQIRTPISGVVTQVNAKIGSNLGANSVAVSLISSSALEIDSYVPQVNIPFIKIGDPAVVTLDSYGDDLPFAATVVSIDPAETVRDGLSTYRIKLQFVTNDDRVKSGMTGNILITTEKKSNVISVPQGIIIDKNGQKFVIVIENGKNIEKLVQTGSVSSVGQIEIVSGLNEGDIIVLQQASK
ncbi:MAG: efflux RND transporter periplasmic adaptor subunit [Candidatus Pacebacteria bacterium]|nr:efflux RND transporter periplasmic adaptor subunit [Candidatus Paceibacterota bacterium]